MLFTTHNKVRMHDVDMAGILYFPRQFRFAHDALEEFVEQTGLTFDQLFRKEHFVFVIVHAEADYLAPLRVGDKLEVTLAIEEIGTTSFSVQYHIYKSDKTLVGRAKTVHVTLDSKSRTKIPIPLNLKNFLTPYLIKSKTKVDK